MLNTVDIGSDEVRRLLSKVNTNKSSGPDGITPRLLRDCSNEWVQPIGMLFQKSLDEGYVPADWRIANTTPIFEKGDKSRAENYRPISLTFVICKIMEKIIRRQLMEHLTTKDLLVSVSMAL